MTYQEILEGIARHRANPLITTNGRVRNLPVKIEEIEWALQALAEKLRDEEALLDIAKAMQPSDNKT